MDSEQDRKKNNAWQIRREFETKKNSAVHNFPVGITHLVEVIKCLVEVGHHTSWWFIGDLNRRL